MTRVYEKSDGDGQVIIELEHIDESIRLTITREEVGISYLRVQGTVTLVDLRTRIAAIVADEGTNYHRLNVTAFSSDGLGEASQEIRMPEGFFLVRRDEAIAINAALMA